MKEGFLALESSLLPAADSEKPTAEATEKTYDGFVKRLGEVAANQVSVKGWCL